MQILQKFSGKLLAKLFHTLIYMMILLQLLFLLFKNNLKNKETFTFRRNAHLRCLQVLLLGCSR